MLRKILPFLLAVCLVCLCTGCMRRNESSSSSSTVSGSSSKAPSSASRPESSVPDSSLPESSGEMSGTSPTPDASAAPDSDAGAFAPFRDALRGVYGENYRPDTRLTDEQVRTELGLDDSLYEEVYAENVSGGSHPDTFIAVKAKEGKTEEVKQKLIAYKRHLSQSEDYKDYADHIEAAQVFAEGDYVFFLLTGNGGSVNGETTQSGDSSEGLAERLGKEVQRGIDAIREALGMM